MIGRRGFLKALGIGAISAPVAIKGASDEFMSKGVSFPSQASVSAFSKSYDGVLVTSASINEGAYTDSVLEEIVKTGIWPDWKRAEVLDNLKRTHPNTLDSSVAPLRSVSLAAKRAITLNKAMNEHITTYKEDKLRYADRASWYSKLQSAFSSGPNPRSTSPYA